MVPSVQEVWSRTLSLEQYLLKKGYPFAQVAWHCATSQQLLSVEKGTVVMASSAAETYMKAWASQTWICDPAQMPPPPATLEEMYQVHKLMQDHPLAESAFGGLAGYKLGAVGVVPGEPGISAPLFKRFVVDAPAGTVSAAEINMHNLEAEVGVIMEHDLNAKADGTPYSVEEVRLTDHRH